MGGDHTFGTKQPLAAEHAQGCRIKPGAKLVGRQVGAGAGLTVAQLIYDILVIMTIFLKKPMAKLAKTSTSKIRKGHWVLQDAKARFSELVRLVRSEGPQHVTVHGRDEVVVIAVEEFRRLKGSSTGQALINSLQASPHRHIEIAPARVRMPVREVGL